MDNQELIKINQLIDSNARILVGTLLKRIEILTEAKALTPSLYKALIREHVYEQSRSLKELMRVHFGIGKVIFKSKGGE